MDKFVIRTENDNDVYISSGDECVVKESATSGAIKRTKGISTVWKYFKRSSDKKLAKCLTCAKEYKTSGNTSNLKDHLKRMHPTLEEEEEEESTECSSSSRSTSAKSSFRSMDAYFKRAVEYDEHSQRKKDIDEALTQFIAEYYQPFNVVENASFKKLIKVLDPRYVMPSKNTMKNVFCKTKYENLKNKLKKRLECVDNVAITTDLWTSAATESYLTLTCHFIDSDFILRTSVLSTKKMLDVTNHKADNIANSIEDVLNEWNIANKVTCIVTDNDSSMISACHLLQKPNLPCFAHTLNLVVQDSLADVNLKKLIVKCKEIVHFFKSSTIANEKLKKEQNCESPLKVIQDVATRWNSTYLMIERFLKIKDPVFKILLHTIKAPNPLTAEEVNVLIEVEQLLRPFMTATAQLSGNYVTVSMIIPIVHGIYTKIIEIEVQTQTNIARTLANNLLKGIRSRLFKYETRSVCRMATISDPRFKKAAFMSYTNADQACVLFEKEIINYINEAVDNTSPAKTSSHSSSSSLFSFLEDKRNEKPKSKKADAIIIKRQYLERDNTSQNTNPLDFWKVIENEFSPLRRCAVKYLCVPATSVESERTFSTAGLIVTQQRNRLKDKNVDMLVFLSKNKWIV